MKRFGKIILACTFFTAILAVSLKAQPASASAGSAVVAPASASAETAGVDEEKVPSAAPEIFNVLGLPITNSMICTWIVAALIIVIVRVTTWNNIKEIPSGGQNMMEALVEGWEKLIGDILEPRVARWVFPFATTYFIFIVISNLTDLIPGVGSIGSYHQGHFTPFFRPPTTDANLTVAMAGIFLVLSLFWAVRYNGFFGFFKHVFGVKVKTNKWVFPIISLLFLFIGLMEAVSIFFARPVALAMRLYGNVFAGETMLDMGLHIKSWLGSLAITLTVYFYETFVCGVQAFVYALLVVAFVGTMCSHSEEETSH